MFRLQLPTVVISQLIITSITEQNKIGLKDHGGINILLMSSFQDVLRATLMEDVNVTSSVLRFLGHSEC